MCDRLKPVEAKGTALPAYPNVDDALRLVLDSLQPRVPAIRASWNSASPFHYAVIDDFLPAQLAEDVDASYPVPHIDGWDSPTYTHQTKKFSMRHGFPPAIAQVFQMLANEEVRALLSEITGIPELLDDPDLLGGGLHQILRGGFLDVHVDYNFHPKTKLHRRLNLLVYMNRDWRPEYEGYLQLWELGHKKRQLENIAPAFNRAVIFETNEVSYHGHPEPLATPQNKTRRSLAVYYYTTERETVAPEHNTIYQQSTGVHGYIKTTVASAQAVTERLRENGSRVLALDLWRKVRRKVGGLPPENR